MPDQTFDQNLGVRSCDGLRGRLSKGTDTGGNATVTAAGDVLSWSERGAVIERIDLVLYIGEIAESTVTKGVPSAIDPKSLGVGSAQGKGGNSDKKELHGDCNIMYEKVGLDSILCV